ncbi:hypothetical protein RN001_001898 [Aquatica leii]|uniref:THAP-type domain-containing protein n=1 Tax=Aquatica leii TaxID=1421715 RepID=A0AAN7PGH2_9COLE|nr:hypothetical protein RN001_001898 [Aquatica leii]
MAQKSVGLTSHKNVKKWERTITFDFHSEFDIQVLISECVNINNICASLLRYCDTLFLLCKIWIRNCNRPDLEEKGSDYCHINLRICSVHFKQEMFASLLTNRLKRTAIPTLFEDPLTEI